MRKKPKTAINVETKKDATGENLRGAVKNRRKMACSTKLTMKDRIFEIAGKGRYPGVDRCMPVSLE
jgi:hypothetical protein